MSLWGRSATPGHVFLGTVISVCSFGSNWQYLVYRHEDVLDSVAFTASVKLDPEMFSG